MQKIGMRSDWPLSKSTGSSQTLEWREISTHLSTALTLQDCLSPWRESIVCQSTTLARSFLLMVTRKWKLLPRLTFWIHKCTGYRKSQSWIWFTNTILQSWPSSIDLSEVHKLGLEPLLISTHKAMTISGGRPPLEKLMAMDINSLLWKSRRNSGWLRKSKEVSDSQDHLLSRELSACLASLARSTSLKTPRSQRTCRELGYIQKMPLW